MQSLGLKKSPANVQAQGVGGAKISPIKSCVTLRIKTDSAETPIVEAKAYVVPKVTGHTRSSKAKWESDGRKLADPNYFESAHIPVLLGLNVIPQLYAAGQEIHDGFILQNTKLGWIISGVTDTPTRRKVTRSNVTFLEFLKC